MKLWFLVQPFEGIRTVPDGKAVEVLRPEFLNLLLGGRVRRPRGRPLPLQSSLRRRQSSERNFLV